ncbi:MAG: PDZ domain-containing protein [Deltaproteobacteria bacterium]|nr:PDZ domain-containing protein [Deltaproteobacteria bacterium]
MDVNQIALKARDYVFQIKDNLTIPKSLFGINIFFGLLFIWLAGYFGAKIIERELMVSDTPTAKHNPLRTRQQDSSMRYDQFKPILDYNLFNVEVGTISEEKAIVEQPKNSTALKPLLANLTLLGVYQGAANFCILRDNQKNTEGIFGINEEVFNTKATIEKIEAGIESPKVYIRSGKEVGILEYPLDKQADQTTEIPSSSKSAINNLKKHNAGKPSSNAKKYTKNGKDFYISSAEVDAELNDFSKLLNQARVVPYFKAGKHEGYQIKAIDKSSLYEKLGLKNYDVIKEINGNPIDSPEKALNLLKMLRNENEITLKIERKEKPETLSYHIN